MSVAGGSDGTPEDQLGDAVAGARAGRDDDSGDAMAGPGAGRGREDDGDGGTAAGKRHTGARRGARRAVAAPTNTGADQSDDVPGGTRQQGRAAERLDPRDTWILEQRPPHWD